MTPPFIEFFYAYFMDAAHWRAEKKRDLLLFEIRDHAWGEALPSHWTEVQVQLYRHICLALGRERFGERTGLIQTCHEAWPGLVDEMRTRLLKHENSIRMSQREQVLASMLPLTPQPYIEPAALKVRPSFEDWCAKYPDRQIWVSTAASARHFHDSRDCNGLVLGQARYASADYTNLVRSAPKVLLSHLPIALNAGLLPCRWCFGSAIWFEAPE